MANKNIPLIVHQLKAPSSAVRISLKMLIDGDFGKLNKEQKGILEKTYQKNEALINLIESLLEEAKNEENGFLINKSLVNLEDLVNLTADFYKDEMLRKKIDFRFNRPEGGVSEVSADSEKIKMVIQNLFDNAVKYTPDKGKIEVSITPQKEEIEFKIKDTGIGIPEDQKGKIFKRFSRVATGLGAKTKGTGLGLAVVKDVIEEHHGKIWFQSKENEGSTFFFSLPC